MHNTSLLFRVGAAMAIIVTLGLISMFSSVFIAKNSEGFAAAINQAGTLRMQSYRIASSLVHRETPLTLDDGQGVTGRLVEEFEGRLFSPGIHNVLGRGTDPSVIDALPGGGVALEGGDAAPAAGVSGDRERPR
ncbi:MAG: type IV pili methyl-accepting chemotaxis transducer N-terminal domain-containing protein [Candidatus Sedimenticola endophacoides]